MNWQRANGLSYFQLCEDGRYSVCRIGIAGEMFYEAWRTRKHEDGPHLIATNLPTSQAAREVAEEDDGE